MFINSNNLLKSIVRIVEREKPLLDEVEKMNERYHTAHNLKNQQEFIAIENEGAILQKKLNMHVTEKIMAMTMIVSKNKNYYFN